MDLVVDRGQIGTIRTSGAELCGTNCPAVGGLRHPLECFPVTHSTTDCPTRHFQSLPGQLAKQNAIERCPVRVLAVDNVGSSDSLSHSFASL